MLELLYIHSKESIPSSSKQNSFAMAKSRNSPGLGVKAERNIISRSSELNKDNSVKEKVQKVPSILLKISFACLIHR
jgi:hypothetical protein